MAGLVPAILFFMLSYCRHPGESQGPASLNASADAKRGPGFRRDDGI